MEKKTLPISVIVRFLGYCRGGHLTGLKTLLAPYDLSLIERETVYKGIRNAIKGGSEAVLRFLLTLPDYERGYHGAAFLMKSWYLAYRFGTESLLKCFTYPDGEPKDPACCRVPALIGAARRGNLKIFQQIYSEKLGDSNYKTQAVFEAARCGHTEIVLWACQRIKFNLKAASEGACRGGQKKLIEALIQQGDFNLIAGIVNLVEKGHLTLLKSILERVGFTPKGGGIAWDRVAYIAVRAGHWRIAKYLVSLGIDISDFPSHVMAQGTYTDKPKTTRRMLELPVVPKFKWPHPCEIVQTAIARHDVIFIETCLRAGYNKFGVYVVAKPIPGIEEMCLSLLVRGWDLEPRLIQEFIQHYELESITLTLHLTRQRTTIAWLQEFLGPILKSNLTQLCLLYI